MSTRLAGNHFAPRRAIAVIAVVGLVGLGGCSVAKGIAIQGNLTPLYVSTAATDVLLAQKIGIAVKPVCTAANNQTKSYSCSGTTSTGKPIQVTVADSTAANPDMVITVGGTQVFSGSIEAVIEQNAETTK